MTSPRTARPTARRRRAGLAALALGLRRSPSPRAVAAAASRRRARAAAPRPPPATARRAAGAHRLQRRRRDQGRRGRRGRVGRGERQRGRGRRGPRHRPAALAGLRRRQPAGRVLRRRRRLRRLRRRRQPLPLRRPDRPTPTTSTRRCATRSPSTAQAYCVPKDFSTLALQINTESWKKAGLTDADIPTTWDELADVAQQAHHHGPGRPGDRPRPRPRRRVPGAERRLLGGRRVRRGHRRPSRVQRRGAASTSRACSTAATPCCPGTLDAGWGGEAFGTEQAAMTIEGNWIRGAMENDYPDVDYTVAELPEGPAGKGTLLVHPVLGHRRRVATTRRPRSTWSRR